MKKYACILMSILLMLGLCACSAPAAMPAPTSTPVPTPAGIVFNDVALEAKVRTILNKPEGPILPEDVKDVTELDLHNNFRTICRMKY